MKPDDPSVPPSWPWVLDESERGTKDFRASRLGMVEARLENAAGQGLELLAAGDRGARACLAPEGVWWQLLMPTSPYLAPGQRIKGEFVIQLQGEAICAG